MTDVAPARTNAPAQSSRLHTIAVVLGSLLIPLPILVGRLIEAGFDAANPAGVDVSQDLAYLRELLGLSFGFLGVLLLAIIAVIVQLYRRERSAAAIRLPVIVVVAQIVIGILLLVVNGIVTGIEDSYSAALVLF